MAQRKSLTIATLVLLSGVALSVAASRWVGAEMLRCAQLRFDVAAANAVVQVERRFAAYAEVLTGLRALFHVGDVSREGFYRFTEALELKGRFPGFQVLNYAPYVPAGSRQAFEKAMQQDPSRPALPRFSIDPPGDRDGYHPFTLLAPLEGNEHLFGRDIAVAARTALDVARDTGKLTTSGKLIQVRGKQQQVGLALRLPVYRAGMPTDTLSQRRSAYLGSVGAGFLVTPMFADLPGVPHGVRVRLYEGGPEPIVEGAEAPPMPEADRLMFDSDAAGRAPAPAAAATPQEPPARDRFRRVQSFKLGDRLWAVDVSAPIAQGERPVETWAPLAVLLAGIAISAALSGMLFGLLVSRLRASALAP
jgi:CHASE1-domain containing sensor protein